MLAGSDKETIMEMVNNFESEGEQRDIFGEGDASEKTAKINKGLMMPRKKIYLRDK